MIFIMTILNTKKIKTSLRLPLLIIIMLSVSACSTAPKINGDVADIAYFDGARINNTDGQYGPREISDPWEGFNRTMYRFNYRVDKYVFLPFVAGYKAVTPDIVESGIHNFFNNIREISTLYNSVFQLNFTKTYQTTGRFITNTTVGLLGLIDVASYVGIPKHQEDFGQTMGYWGVSGGPYLVLPFLGPSTLRDGVGGFVDSTAIATLRDELDMKPWEEATWSVLDAVDTRANVPFRYYETGSPFEYEMIRGLWLMQRKMQIEK